MRFNRRRLKLPKGRLILGGGSPSPLGDKGQMSFVLVIIFLALFGVIVLAELFFMDERNQERFGVSNGIGGGLFYEMGGPIAGDWETPKPLPIRGNARLPQTQPEDSNAGSKNDRYQKNLQKHQEEMESLIRNISMRIQSSVAAAAAERAKNAPQGSVPYNYSLPLDANVDIDPSLTRHRGHDALWQPVRGSMAKFYVYSAFYDPRSSKFGPSIVRVIGATKTKHPDKVFCRLYLRDQLTGNVSSESHVRATVTAIRENWYMKYSAVFVICPLPASARSNIPEAISIVHDTKAPASNQLPVHYHREEDWTRTLPSDAIGVCVKPLHFHYNKTSELIEFIELNRILGVSHFTLYNHTVSRDVDCLLRHYQSEGLVDLLPWKLNMASQSEIRTEGLFAALNDCLYRNINTFKYLMLIDFDEFVIPRHNNTLMDMIRFLEAQKSSSSGSSSSSVAEGISSTSSKLAARLASSISAKAAAPAVAQKKVTSSFSFQNAFFYLQFKDDEAERAKDPSAHQNLRVLLKTRRKSKFNPQKQRSKYICLPRNVREAGNHFIWEFSDGTNLNVPTSVAFLHHYRVCEFGGSECIHTDSTVDRTVHKFRRELLERVSNVKAQMAKSNWCEK